MNISEPIETVVQSVSAPQEVTGVDGQNYEFITITLKPFNLKKRSYGNKITKAIFNDSVAYEELLPIAEAAKEENFNEYEKLLAEFNKIHTFVQKITAKVAPYYVTERNEEGKEVIAKYPKHMTDKAGLDMITDNCTLYIFEGEEDPQQELDSWWSRLENRKFTVKPIDAKTLAQKNYGESVKALLNKHAESAESAAPADIKTEEEQENETPQ